MAGQNLVLRKHLQQPLAPVERLRCPERLWERSSAAQMRGWERQEAELVALKSAILVLYLEAACPPHLAARARCHPDALAPGPEGVTPLPSCELVEGSSIAAASRRAGVSATGQGVPELPCDPSHSWSVHDMGSFISRPVLIFPTILNRATNGFETAVSRVLLGGRQQT